MEGFLNTIQRSERKKCAVPFLLRISRGSIQLERNREVRQMNPRGLGVGDYPHLQIYDGPGPGPVLYSPAIQHLGLIRPRTTESGGSGGLGLTVWIMRARQGQGNEPHPVRALLGCQKLGDASQRGEPSARSRGAGESARFFEARTTPQVESVKTWEGSILSPFWELIEFREISPVPDGGFRNG